MRIVGAGIGGLACAYALALHGFDVAVYEQADGLAEVGAGVQISPNGARVLRALGFGPTLDQTAASQAVVLRDFRRGRLISLLDLTRYGDQGGYYALHRADLVNWLFKAAQEIGVTFHFGQKAQFSPEDDDVTIAADGVNSVHRVTHFNPTKPLFSGQVAWRATVATDGAAQPQSTVYLGPGKHLVTYPIRGGALINLVAVDERSNWAEDGWSHADDPAHLRAAFADFTSEVDQLLERVEGCFLWGLHNYPVEKKWFKGNMALLGDAAHPMLPFMAQGANMALEDAWVLATSLAGHDTAAAAFAAYQTRRHARVSRVVAASKSNAQAFHLSGIKRHLAHSVLRIGDRFVPSANLRRFDWLYGYDVRAESFEASGGDI